MKKKETVREFQGRSFILARQGEMNDRQKAAILALVERELLGRVALTPESSEEEIREFLAQASVSGAAGEQIRSALRDGKNICTGHVSMEQSMNGFEELMGAVWDALEENSD